jgi:hypothetical protein
VFAWLTLLSLPSVLCPNARFFELPQVDDDPTSLALSTPPSGQSHPTSIISGPKPNEHIARAGKEDTKQTNTHISTMADLQGRKIFKVFNQDFIVDERYTVTKELGQGAYGIVWCALTLLFFPFPRGLASRA